MKKVLFYASFAVILTSCSVASMTKSLYGNTYSYKYDLIKPSEDTSMIFTDGKIKFIFSVSNSEVDFIAKNLSDQPMRVMWDDASFIQFGNAEKVMHKGVKYIDRNNSQPSTVIPVNSSIDDLILPTSKIYYREGTYTSGYSNPGGWETKDLFPVHDLKKEETKKFILGLKGQEFSIYLPIKTGEKELGYTFTFRIRSVECSTCVTTKS